MKNIDPTTSEYSSYLALPELLAAQRPRSAEHDELVFIVAHQIHELWFKLTLHELAALQGHLEAGRSAQALHTLRRTLRTLRAVLSPIDVLQTFTAHQFVAFRAKLGNASGAQSAQFREIEATLGRRHPRLTEAFAVGTIERRRIEAAIARRSVYDSWLRYLRAGGHPVPSALVWRAVATPPRPSTELQDILLDVYRTDGVEAQVCERLFEVDQSVQEWRYRHLQLVERVIGAKVGTGGTQGASHLATTTLQPIFADLWAVRTRL